MWKKPSNEASRARADDGRHWGESRNKWRQSKHTWRRRNAATETVCELATDEETAEDGQDCEGTTAFNATDEVEKFDACKQDKIVGSELPIARATASAIKTTTENQMLYLPQ